MKPFSTLLYVWVLLFAVAGLTSRSAAAQNGPDIGPASIIYINGVLNEKINAQVSAILLQHALTTTTASGIDVDYVHNPSGGTFLDLFQSLQQTGTDTTSFVRMMVDIDEWTPAFKDALLEAALRIAEQQTETGTVTNELRDRIVLREGAGNKVIVVSHSQGNFFANAAYRALTPQQQSCAYQVGVANPDLQQTHAHYEYVTLTQDEVVRFIKRPGFPTAPPTTDSEFEQLPIWDNTYGHAFVESYLFADTTSRREILTHIATARAEPREVGSPCDPNVTVPEGVGPRWTLVFAEGDAQILGQSSCTKALVDCEQYYHGIRALDQSAASSNRLSAMTGNFIANLEYSSSAGFLGLSGSIDGMFLARSSPLLGPENTPNYYAYGESRGVLTLRWNLNATGFFRDGTRMTSFNFVLSGNSNADLSQSPTPLPRMDSDDPPIGIPLCAQPQIRLTSDTGSTITLGGIFGTDTKFGSIATGHYTVTITATADQLQLNSGVLDDDSATIFPRREIECRLNASFRLKIQPSLP